MNLVVGQTDDLIACGSQVSAAQGPRRFALIACASEGVRAKSQLAQDPVPDVC